MLIGSGCTTTSSQIGHTYGSNNGDTCINIKEPISLTEFQNEYKYIEAEIEDLQALKKKGELTNVEYLKKTDKIKSSLPREFIWGETSIVSFQEEKSRYIATPFPYLPDPFRTGIGPVIYLEAEKFPTLDEGFDDGETVNVLITNLDSTTGGFYYTVVKLKIGENEITNSDFCL